MPIDPRHLRILLAVSRSGSFTAAAEELNMSQPAVSIAIAQLEDRVGLPLVIRDRKGAVPTPAGEVLLRRARTIETVLERAAQEVALHHHRIEGPLLIGGTPGALMSPVPPVMARLGAEGLHRPVSLLEVRGEDLAGLLRGRRIDLRCAPPPARPCRWTSRNMSSRLSPSCWWAAPAWACRSAV